MTTQTTSTKRSFREGVDGMLKMQRGENGALEYTDAGVGSNVLALSQLVRGGDVSSLVREILHESSSDDAIVVDLVVLLFATRNCRGGKGEKKLAFDIFLHVWVRYPETCKKLLRLFPIYGYWKDLLLLMAQAVEDPVFTAKGHTEELIQSSVALMKSQLDEDLTSLRLHKTSLRDAMDEDHIAKLEETGPKISLLAKWLPRERSSFDKKIEFVKRFVGEKTAASPGSDTCGADLWQSTTKALYRQQVAELTGVLDLPEVFLAAKREDEIKFGKVAARATMNLRNVFLNQTPTGKRRSDDPKRIKLAERFLEYVVERGLKGGQLQPHEIVAKCLNKKVSKEMELVLDAQWKNLWSDVVDHAQAKASEQGSDFNPSRMVPLCDVSGSMSGTPMEVAIALSLGVSEITHDAYKSMILTFHTNPQWHRVLQSDTIVEKVQKLARAPWGGSTDFEKAYERILDVAETEKLERSEVPVLIVFSDMQFNSAASTPSIEATATLHSEIKKKFLATATRLGWDDPDPTPMIYWNLRNCSGHPVEKDTEGAVLLSGFSPTLLKLVMHGDALRDVPVEVIGEDGTVEATKIRVTPEEILRKMLDDTIYDPVREVLLLGKEQGSHLR